MELESPNEHGWDGDGKVVWSDICYPAEVDELLSAEDGDNGSCSDEDYEDDLNIEIEDTTEF
jgi:hypothetical protein